MNKIKKMKNKKMLVKYNDYHILKEFFAKFLFK